MWAEEVALDLAVYAGAKIQIASKTGFQLRPDLREQIVRRDAVKHARPVMSSISCFARAALSRHPADQ
jgi:hypothetical protein